MPHKASEALVMLRRNPLSNIELWLLWILPVSILCHLIWAEVWTGCKFPHQFSWKDGHILLKFVFKNPKFELSGHIIALLWRYSSISIFLNIFLFLWSLVFFLSAHPWLCEDLYRPIRTEYLSSAMWGLLLTLDGSHGLSPESPYGSQSLWSKHNFARCFLCWGTWYVLPLRHIGLSPPLLLSYTLTWNYFFLKYLNFNSVLFVIQFFAPGDSSWS